MDKGKPKAVIISLKGKVQFKSIFRVIADTDREFVIEIQRLCR